MPLSDLAQGGKVDFKELQKISHAIQSGKLSPTPTQMFQIQELMQIYKRQVLDGPEADSTSELVVPQPGFIVKSQEKGGKKVYINVCCSEKVALPAAWKEGQIPLELKEALEANEDHVEPTAELIRIPVSIGELREERDHLNQTAYIVDLLVNHGMVQTAHAYRGYQQFLARLAIDRINAKHNLNVDHRYKVPKLQYKGKVVGQYIRKDQILSIQELAPADVDEPPTFALPVSRPATAPQKAQADEAAQPQSPAAAKPQQGKGKRPASPAASPGSPWAPLPNSHSLPRLEGTHAYAGRPVHTAVLSLVIPSSVIPADGPGLQPESIAVEVQAAELYVTVPGCKSFHTSLTFPVDPDKSTAILHSSTDVPAHEPTGSHKTKTSVTEVDRHMRLDLRLPIIPARSLLPFKASAMQLSFESAKYLELEP